jgi:uncharacterized protein (DUF1499 family)
MLRQSTQDDLEKGTKRTLGYDGYVNLPAPFRLLLSLAWLLLVIACGVDAHGDEPMPRMSPKLADEMLGLKDGALSPCPNMPNCVCSQHPNDTNHHVQPLPLGGAPEEGWARLQDLLQATPRVKIIRQDGGYLHARFTTRMLRFEDDVEFLRDDAAGVIHVRSASRLGYSDIGKNRKRVEQLRQRLEG